MTDQTSITQNVYVNAVLTNYLRLPQTPLRSAPRDYHIATRLWERGIPLKAVYAAFIIATARRQLRHPKAYPLDKIQSLGYFIHAIEEVQERPPHPAYLRNLVDKLKPWVHAKEALLRLSTASTPTATLGQTPAVPDGR